MTSMRSVTAEKVREGDAHTPKGWAAGPTTGSNQSTLGYDVSAKRNAAAAA